MVSLSWFGKFTMRPWTTAIFSSLLSHSRARPRGVDVGDGKIFLAR
jgi:hypothetical protein